MRTLEAVASPDRSQPAETMSSKRAKSSSCDDSDLAPGDSVSMVGRRQTQAPQAPARRQTPKKGDDDSNDYRPLCHLCLKAFGDEKPSRHNRREFHLRCFHAVRSYRRLGDSRAADQLMISGIEEFRKRVLPLVVSADGSRCGHARQDAREQVVREEFSKYKKEERLHDYVFLPRRRFIAWRKLWDGYSSGEASDEFHKMLDEQSSAYEDDDNEPRVKVKDNEKARTTTGRSTNKKTILIAGESLAATPVAGRSDSSRASGSGAQVRGRANDRQRPDRKRAKRSPSSSSPPSTLVRPPFSRRNSGTDNSTVQVSGRRADEDVRSRGACAGDRRPPLKRQGAVAVEVVSDSGDQVKDEDEEEAPEAPAGSTRKKLPGEIVSKTKGTGNTGGILTSMRAKTKLKAQTQAALTAASASKSVGATLKALAGKLTKEQANELVQDTDSIVKQWEDAVKELVDAVKAVDSAKADKLEPVTQQCHRCIRKVEAVETLAQDQVEAIQYLQDLDKLQARKEKMKDRYKRVKVANRLMAGNFGKGLANVVASILEVQEENKDNSARKDEPFANEVTVWTGKKEPAEDDVNTFFKSVSTVFDQLPAELKKKWAILEKSLEESPKWTGAMVRLPFACLSETVEELKLGVEVLSITEPSAAPWLVALRPHTWRWGPNNFPLPAIGAFVKALTDNLALLLLPADGILEKGIALPDAGAFFETESGKKFLTDSLKVVTLSKGEVCWVPTGCVAAPLFLGDDGSQKYGFMSVWSLMSPAWTAALKDTTAQAVTTWNMEYLSTQSSSKMWRSRYDMLSNLVSQTSETRAAEDANATS